MFFFFLLYCTIFIPLCFWQLWLEAFCFWAVHSCPVLSQILLMQTNLKIDLRKFL